MLFLNYSPELSEIDYSIYNIVTQHSTSIQYMSVRDIAKLAHVSTASIMRFCKKFECNGFTEFKYRMAHFVQDANKKMSVQTHMGEMSLINFLSNTSTPFFQKKIQEAVTLLLDKELIIFAGLGSSKITADYGAHYFSSFASMSFVLEETMNYPVNHFPLELAPKIAIICLSVSGESEKVIKFVKKYHASQITLISITNSSHSTLAKLSDLNFSYHIHQEKIEHADITSQLPPLYILELLAKSVSLAKNDA